MKEMSVQRKAQPPEQPGMRTKAEHLKKGRKRTERLKAQENRGKDGSARKYGCGKRKRGVGKGSPEKGRYVYNCTSIKNKTCS